MQSSTTRTRVSESYFTAASNSTYGLFGVNSKPQLLEQRFTDAYYTNLYYYYSNSSVYNSQSVVTLKVAPADLNNVKIGHWVEYSGAVANPSPEHCIRVSSTSVLPLGIVVATSGATNNTASIVTAGSVFSVGVPGTGSVLGYQQLEGDYNQSVSLYLSSDSGVYGSSSTEGVEGVNVYLGYIVPGYADDSGGATSSNYLVVNPIAV